MNNEAEIMDAYSHSAAERVQWASLGDAEYKRANPHHANHPSRVYYNRMLGISDDGLRVIGKECSDLPGGVRFKEAVSS